MPLDNDVRRSELEKLAEQIGHRFQDLERLEQAFVHASMGNEGKLSNERLEFLGDAVLQCFVSDHLFRQFGTENEGELTSRRKRIVSREPLAKVCRALDLIRFLEYGRGLTSQELNSERLQANLVEAVLGALWLDGGQKPAKAFVHDHILRVLGPMAAKPSTERDPKTRLLHFCQARGLGQPTYRLVAQHGPDHAIEFESAVDVQDEEIATGHGPSKQSAEREAAEQAITLLRSRESTDEKC